jgi:hypothetical protein
MDRSYLKVGAPVVTARNVPNGGLAGSGVSDELLKNRRASSEGRIEGFVQEQAADVWKVRHADGQVGVYHRDELVIPNDVSMPGGFR